MSSSTVSQLRSVVDALRQYTRNPTDENACAFQRQLQILTVINDMKALEPSSLVAVELYIGLLNLVQLDNRKGTTIFVWNTVDLMNHIASNEHIRIFLQQELDCISVFVSFLSPNLVNEKLDSLLNLLEKLSRGIKIPLRYPYLNKLLKVLKDLLDEPNHAFLVRMILCNVLYQNPIARRVQLELEPVNSWYKKLALSSDKGALQLVSSFCFHLTSSEHSSMKFLLEDYWHLIMVTMSEGMREENPAQLRLALMFMKEIAVKCDLTATLSLSSHLQDLLVERGQGNMECTELMLKYCESLVSLYSNVNEEDRSLLLKFAIEKMAIEALSSSSLQLCSKIIAKLGVGVLGELQSELVLATCDVLNRNTTDTYLLSKMSSAIQLCHTMMEDEQLKASLLRSLNPAGLTNFILVEKSRSSESLQTLVQAIYLLRRLGEEKKEWEESLKNVLSSQDVLFSLALGLYSSRSLSPKCVKLCLDFLSSSPVGADDVSNILVNVSGVGVSPKPETPSVSAESSLGIAQSSRDLLDVTSVEEGLRSLQEYLRTHDEVDFTSSHLVDLYEVKLAKINSTITSLEETLAQTYQLSLENKQMMALESRQNAHLIDQLKESDRKQRALREEMAKEKAKISQTLLQSEENFEKCKESLKRDLRASEEKSKKLQQNIQETEDQRDAAEERERKLKKRLKLLEDQNMELCKHVEEANSQIQDQGSNIQTLEKRIEQKGEELKKSLARYEGSRKRLEETQQERNKMELLLKSKDKKLEEKEAQIEALSKVKRDLEETKERMRSLVA